MKSTLDLVLSELTRYKNRSLIKSEIEGITSIIKTITPKTSTLVQNDGVECRLLVLGGTLPIDFSGAQYNIPIEIFIMENYPDQAPMVFVRPTSDMMISPGNPHVDLSGTVSIPYLSSWNSSSSLHELFTYLTSEFSSRTPLYSKPNPNLQPQAMKISVANPSSYSANSNPNPYPSSFGSLYYIPRPSGQINQIPYSTSPYPNLNINNNINPSGINVLPTVSPVANHIHTQPVSSNHLYSLNPEILKSRLLDDVKMKLQKEAQICFENIAGDMDVLLLQQHSFASRKLDLEDEIANLKKLKSKLTDSVMLLEVKNKQLDKYLEKEKSEPEKDIEDYLEPFDGVSEQLMKLYAEHNATEEAIIELTQNFQKDKYRSSEFTREVRRMAKNQFLCKAHILKINRALAQSTRK